MNLKNIYINKVLIHLVRLNEKVNKISKYFLLALNIQEDIIRLIATGIILLELLLQVPVSAREEYLVPFDSERIRVRD